MKTTLIDPSQRTGVFIGDLKYGRCNGHTSVKHKDFTGDSNSPVVPLVLVEPRDKTLWKKDSKLKQFKQHVHNHQEFLNYMLESHVASNPNSNIHLTIGRQRI